MWIIITFNVLKCISFYVTYLKITLNLILFPVLWQSLAKGSSPSFKLRKQVVFLVSYYSTLKWCPCHYNLSKIIEHITPRVKSNIDYGLWMIMKCPSRFINCNKCITLAKNVNNMGGYTFGGQRIFIFVSSLFFCEPKIILK